MRRAAKVDATQQAIVDALRRCGVAVAVLGQPLDLLVCCKGITSLVECKSPGGTFTKAQAEFMSIWPGTVHVVRTPEEAVRAILGPEVMR